ncbi:vWA domain-containing protein [Flindersiella endophytica]
MTNWIRRNYDGIGPTQYPPGPHLHAVQEPHVGKVFLCIDVSGSMSTTDAGRSRLDHAVAGARQFVQEAHGAGYDVGLILWDTGIHRFVPLSSTPEPVLDALDAADIGGGTNVTPALRKGTHELGSLTGDRVLAIFGDGDLGPVEPALAAARDAAAQGIRIVVRGLGEASARSLSRLATDATDNAVIDRTDEIQRGIAGMATSVVSRRRPG